MAGYHLKKDTGAALGPSTALFPVSKRRGADAHEGRESGLAQTIASADGPHVDVLEPKSS
jgi:hypothetical protein